MFNKPSIRSNSLKERRAASQLKKWRKLYKQGLLDQSVIAMLAESNCLKWLLPVDLEKQSNETCIRLCEFIIKNKKQPNQNATKIEEKKLAQFLQTKRRTAYGKGRNKLYQSDLEILKRYNMEYLLKETPESRSNNTCIELCEYIIKNNKSPSTISINEEEKRLAIFLAHKRKAVYGKGKNKLYQSDFEILKRYNMSDLFNKIDLEKESNNTCIELCEFIIENKKSPNQNATKIEEKTLGSFLQKKRQAAKGKGTVKLYKSDLDIIISYNMPNLFNETPELRSNKTCIELCEYIIKNKKSPSKISTNDEEKRLAKFLLHKRQAAKGKGTAKLYQSDLEILKQYNLPDLFKTRGS